MNYKFGLIGINKLRQHRICCRSFIEISWRMRKLHSINRNCFVILNEVKDLESTLNQLDSSLTLRMTVW